METQTSPVERKPVWATNHYQSGMLPGSGEDVILQLALVIPHPPQAALFYLNEKFPRNLREPNLIRG